MICLYCQSEIVGGRPGKKYCNNKCRYASWEKDHRIKRKHPKRIRSRDRDRLYTIIHKGETLHDLREQAFVAEQRSDPRSFDGLERHYWIYCNSCHHASVRCWKCGNNCCNGGYGTLPNGDTCDECPSAYRIQNERDKGETLEQSREPERESARAQALKDCE